MAEISTVSTIGCFKDLQVARCTAMRESPEHTGSCWDAFCRFARGKEKWRLKLGVSDGYWIALKQVSDKTKESKDVLRLSGHDGTFQIESKSFSRRMGMTVRDYHLERDLSKLLGQWNDANRQHLLTGINE